MCQYQANLILFKVNHVLGKKVSITKLTHSIKKYQTPSVPHSIWTNPIHYITCVFGIGALPIPGTCSTIAAIGLAFMLKSLSIDYQIAILIFLNAVGAWICDITNRDFGTHDHSAAGFDEFVTFPICMIHVLAMAVYPTCLCNFQSPGHTQTRTHRLHRSQCLGWVWCDARRYCRSFTHPSHHANYCSGHTALNHSLQG